jgi:hypothetical protein
MKSIPPETQPTKPSDEGSSFLPPATQAPPPPPGPENSWKCCHHKTPWWKIALDVGMLLSAVGAVVAATFYAGMSHSMWREMQTQTCIQREASINADRAWVGLAGTPGAQVSSLKQKEFTAQILLGLKNYGRGPALNVMASSGLATHGHVQDTIAASCNLIFPFVGLRPSNPVSFSGDVSKTQWGEILFPGESFSTGTNTQGDSADIVGQEVFVVGCIVYKDQFRRPHWTKFSYTTGAYASDLVRDASSFRHLYMSTGNNYTDDAEKKPSCSEAP